MTNTSEIENQNLPKNILKKILKIFIFSFLFFVFFILIGISIIFFNENKIKSLVIEELNKYLNTPVFIHPEKIDITFFHTFPNTTLRILDATVMGSHSKFKDTLIQVQTIEFHFSIWKIFQNDIIIYKIYAQNLQLNPRFYKDGTENWNFLKSRQKANQDYYKEKESVNIDLEKIILKNVNINYQDLKNNAIVKLSFDEVNSGFIFKDKNLNIKLNAFGAIQDVKFNNKEFIKNKNFKIITHIQKNNNQYSFEEFNFSLSEMKLKTKGFIVYDSLFKKANMQFEGDDIRPESILSILKYDFNQLPRTNDPIDINGRYILENNSFALQADFEGKDLEIKHDKWNARLQNVYLKGRMEFGSQLKGNFILDYIKGNWNDKPFESRLVIKDFNNPKFDFSFDGEIPVPFLLTLSGKDSLFSCTGNLFGSIKLQCSEQQYNKKEILPDTRLELKLTPNALFFNYKPANKAIAFDSGQIITNNQHVLVQNLALTMGNNQFFVSGEWKKFPGFIFGSEPLEINGVLSTKKWDVKNWMEECMSWNRFFQTNAAVGASGKEKQNKGFRLNLELKANTMLFEDFKAENVFMQMDWKDNQVFAEDIRMNLFGGNLLAALRMDMINEKYYFYSEGSFSNISIKDGFMAFKNFGQQTLTEKNLDGILHGNYLFKGTWDEHFNCLLSTLSSQTEFTVSRGRLKNFEPLKGLSKFISLDELNDIRFDDIKGSLSIEKQTIFLPKTEIKNSAINLSIAGEHSFENVLNYYLTLSLPELLSKKSKHKDEFMPDDQNRRKLFIRIFGPIDNLKFALDKQGIKEKIKEDMVMQKSELKKIIQEEFKGIKDSTRQRNVKFELEEPKNEKQQNEVKNPLKKKKDEDDDEDY